MNPLRHHRHGLAAALSLLLAAPVQAAEPAPASKSLADRRLEVIKVSPAQAAASAPAGRGAGAGAPAEPRSALFSKLPAPSGRPINAARRHEGPGLGIAVPTAAAASQPR